MNEQFDQTIDTIARLLADAGSMLFVTGAGISADSGLPTYRGIGGLYDVDLTEDGLPIEEALSGSMLASNPELTWKYLKQIADATRGGQPNRAHEIIAEMEQQFPRVWTLTQNVDGFHRAAGSENVIEIHGNMKSLSCLQCSESLVVNDQSEFDTPPRCFECGGILRPDVVLFGEQLPEESLSVLRREVQAGFDIVFSVGTSSLFPYIQEPIYLARRVGTPTIEINPDETTVSGVVDYRLPMTSVDALTAIWTQFQSKPC